MAKRGSEPNNNLRSEITFSFDDRTPNEYSTQTCVLFQTFKLLNHQTYYNRKVRE